MTVQTFENLKVGLQKAAFLIAQPESAEEAHKQILQCLLLAEKIESLIRDNYVMDDQQRFARSTEETQERKEIEKVERRLRLWAKRPEQINSQILKAYLKAKRDGLGAVTEEDIRSRVPEQASFDANFAQMKIIAERNHGKVFEQVGEHVKIWPPVESYVSQFEQTVFT